MMKQSFHKPLRAATSLLSVVLIAGCTGGGSSSVSATGDGLTGSATLSVTSVKATGGTDLAAYGSRYYVKGASITVVGACGRGITTIKVNEGAGDYVETANCQVDGTFTWSKTYTAGTESNKTLNFKAYDLSGVLVSGATASAAVRIDDAAPTTPAFTSPAVSGTYTYSGALDAGQSYATITVSGTNSTDTTHLKLNGVLVATTSPGATTWTTTIQVTAGSSTLYQLTAFDQAGNESAAATLTIEYTPSIALKFASFTPGQIATDGTSLYSAEVTGNPHDGASVDAGTTYRIETGLNFVTNQVRSE